MNASMYDAEQGSTSGAHIDMSTSAGTNKLHGSAYVNRGTSWLNAAPFFFKQDDDIPAYNKVPQLHRYTAGGAIGRTHHQGQALRLSWPTSTCMSPTRKLATLCWMFPSGFRDDRSASGAGRHSRTTSFGTNISAARIDRVALALVQLACASRRTRQVAHTQ